MGKCQHKDRKQEPDGYHARCMDCGSTFVPRGTPVPHGSYAGYGRHRELRKGEWAFPIPEECGCSEAAHAWRVANARRPAAKEARQLRAQARVAALGRLHRTFPSAYQALYLEELNRRKMPAGRISFQVPIWDDVLGRLVKEATGRDEWELTQRARSGLAGDREKSITRQAARLRLLIERLAREAGHGGSGD